MREIRPPRGSTARAVRAELRDIEPMRNAYRREMSCQIVHDSIHSRPGWTIEYVLSAGPALGYGSVAVGGPWKDKPAVFEVYIAPEHRSRAFDLFEAFLAASGARFFEIQSNDALSAVMLHAYGRGIASESIVFQDGLETALPSHGAILRRVTPEQEVQDAIAERQGGGEWILEVEGAAVAKGGILFHYNRPYGDIYMEVNEPFRRRGLGSYFVQELKRECRALGAVPCARCNTTNVVSRRTLQRSGFVPFAHILTGEVDFAGG